MTAKEKAAHDMRQQIELVAQDLLVKHGVHGLNFRDIAEALGTTRANIHYHYGSKEALIDEVIVNYMQRTSERFAKAWTDEKLSLAEKVEATIAINKARYLAFNPAGEGASWSLFTRLRIDVDALGTKGTDVLRAFSERMVSATETGVLQAVQSGTLQADTPVRDVSAQIVSIITSAGLTTLDSQSFEGLDFLYRAFLRTVLAAYGAEPSLKP